MDDAPPNVFEAEIERMIEQIGSKNAAKRREAAYFLGEVASDQSVPVLVEVYEKDKDASVRAAAAYSLGMYKAIERALDEGEQDHVTDLLRRIEEDGKLGRRAATGRTIKIILALIVSLVLMAGIYAFSADIKGLLFGSTKTRAEVISDVRSEFTLVRNDTRTLQGELLNVISNRPLSCIAYFNNPPRYVLDPVDARSYRDLAAINDELLSVYDSFSAAKVRYDDACNNGTEFGAAQAQESFQMLLPALQALDPLDVELTQVEAESLPPATAAPATGATAAPVNAPPTSAGGEVAPIVATTAEAMTTAEPVTLAPVATLPPEIKQHLPTLYNIVDDVLGPRGASSLLVQYWEDVQATGSTGGCQITNPPTVPNNNAFIPEADFILSPDLERANQLVNSGLASLRDGWTRFQFACNAHSLADEVAVRLPEARVAQSAFEAARVLLDQVQAAS